jgi:hypothetical protein
MAEVKRALATARARAVPLPVLRRRRLRQCLQDHGRGLRPVYARLAIGPIAPLAIDDHVGHPADPRVPLHLGHRRLLPLRRGECRPRRVRVQSRLHRSADQVGLVWVPDLRVILPEDDLERGRAPPVGAPAANVTVNTHSSLRKLKPNAGARLLRKQPYK